MKKFTFKRNKLPLKWRFRFFVNLYLLATEPFIKRFEGDLKWRMRVRKNHLYHSSVEQIPTFLNMGIQAVRLFYCNILGHKWGDFENVKYGDFGQERVCNACRLHEVEHNGESSFHETHHRNGWKTITQ